VHGCISLSAILNESLGCPNQQPPVNRLQPTGEACYGRATPAASRGWLPQFTVVIAAIMKTRRVRSAPHPNLWMAGCGINRPTNRRRPRYRPIGEMKAHHDRYFWKFDPHHEGQVSKSSDHEWQPTPSGGFGRLAAGLLGAVGRCLGSCANRTITILQSNETRLLSAILPPSVGVSGHQTVRERPLQRAAAN
jgi:hypothetical protein